ncbi:hypothetical protein [Saccharothrix deserti]|uniref:hypothetical protein n=1 Tax=Saccharothrix deserti TaxID=2593674 RepID=UPI00131EC73A|nr:hypothetical protein [Saccharothrix deserti]
MNDDDILERLRHAAAAVDPVPDLVTRSAQAALSTRRVDEELAELVADSELLAAGRVRAPDDDVRLLSFETAGVSVELQVEYAGGLVSMRGLVSGASGEAVVEVAGERHAVPIDEEGWFVATGLPRGATRVRVTAVDGTAVVTRWTSL